jgi:hypothetical protein
LRKKKKQKKHNPVLYEDENIVTLRNAVRFTAYYIYIYKSKGMVDNIYCIIVIVFSAGSGSAVGEVSEESVEAEYSGKDHHTADPSLWLAVESSRAPS